MRIESRARTAIVTAIVMQLARPTIVTPCATLMSPSTASAQGARDRDECHGEHDAKSVYTPLYWMAPGRPSGAIATRNHDACGQDREARACRPAKICPANATRGGVAPKHAVKRINAAAASS